MSSSWPRLAPGVAGGHHERQVSIDVIVIVILKITVEVAPSLQRLDKASLVIWIFGVDNINNYGNDGDYVNIGTMMFSMKSESDPAKHRR